MITIPGWSINRELAEARKDHKAKSEEASADLDELKARIDEQGTRLLADKEQVAQLLVEVDEQLKEAQGLRSREYEEWREEQGRLLVESAQPFLDELSERLAGANTELAKMRTLRDQTDNLAGRAAASILGGDYGAYALREWFAGVGAYVLGFGGIAFAAVFLIKAVTGIPLDARVTWQFVALKLGITATAAAAAAVAFRLGSRFLERSHASKRAALELKALGPFLADIEDEELVRKSKIAFADRMFGRAWEGALPQEEPQRSPGSIEIADLASKVADVLRGKQAP